MRLNSQTLLVDYLMIILASVKIMHCVNKWCLGALFLRLKTLKELRIGCKIHVYRRVFEGQSLMKWHPLITGNPDSAHITNNSFQNRTIPEYDVEEDDFENYIIEDLA